MIRILLSTKLGEIRWTQADLARATGIRPNTVSEWYNEITTSLKVEHIDKICEVLKCSIGDLIGIIPNKVLKTGKYLIIEEHENQKKKRSG